jgi:hypothetical protein
LGNKLINHRIRWYEHNFILDPNKDTNNRLGRRGIDGVTSFQDDPQKVEMSKEAEKEDHCFASLGSLIMKYYCTLTILHQKY